MSKPRKKICKDTKAISRAIRELSGMEVRADNDTLRRVYVSAYLVEPSRVGNPMRKHNRTIGGNVYKAKLLLLVGLVQRILHGGSGYHFDKELLKEPVLLSKVAECKAILAARALGASG